MMKLLVAALVAAFVAWKPTRLHKNEAPESVLARYESIAADVAAVALDPSEPPVVEGSREKTAFVLASIAFWESGFWSAVDDGSCNRRKLDGVAWCDMSNAWTIWQVHTKPDWKAEGGLTLDGSGFKYARDRSAEWKSEHAAEILHGPQLIADRRLAARLALHMLRRGGVGLWTQGLTARRHALAWLSAHPVSP